jgi:hypothetical protein
MVAREKMFRWFYYRHLERDGAGSLLRTGTALDCVRSVCRLQFALQFCMQYFSTNSFWPARNPLSGNHRKAVTLC